MIEFQRTPLHVLIQAHQVEKLMGFVKKISIYVHMFICLSHPCAKYTNVLFTFYHSYRCYLRKCIL